MISRAVSTIGAPLSGNPRYLFHLDSPAFCPSGAERGADQMSITEAIYAVEIYDAQTNRLLEAYVAQRYPRPYNVAATFGALRVAHAPPFVQAVHLPPAKRGTTVVINPRTGKVVSLFHPVVVDRKTGRIVRLPGTR